MAVATVRRSQSQLQSRSKSQSKSITGNRRRKLTKAQRHDEVKSFINLCFIMLEDDSFKDVAEKTGLSETTVKYLYNGDASLKMHVNTLQVLGAVAGLKLDLTAYDAKITLID